MNRSSGYHSPLYHIRQSQNRVEAWSIQRLPFEPEGWLRDFRQDLCTAVSRLRAGRHEWLYAVYASPVGEMCDPENVLFYNVGTSPFVNAARYGLRFERAFRIGVPCPSPLAGQPLHYHEYFVVPSDLPFRHWDRGATLASWTFESDPKSLRHCALVWYAMKRGQMTASATAPPLRYGLQVQLDVPRGARVSLPGIVKTLFDGIISALHYHDGTDEAELSRRVAAITGAQADDVRALLREKTSAVLGGRKLLYRFRESVQWNPQDDLCLVGELRLNETDRPGWVVRGELFEVCEAVTMLAKKALCDAFALSLLL